MDDKKMTSKEYWNTIKVELSKNKMTTLWIFIAFIFAVSIIIILWTDRESISVMNRLVMLAPFWVPLIFLALFVLAIPIGLARRKRYENSIAGKDLWDITAIKFRRFAIILPSIIVLNVFLSFLVDFLYPSPSFNSYVGKELFAVAVFYAVALISFLVIASLLKRRSPKAITVGYACLAPLFVFTVYSFFSSFFNMSKNGDEGFFLFFLLFILIQGILDIRKVSKYVTGIKKDSEFQKVVQEEIIKVKEEEK